MLGALIGDIVGSVYEGAPIKTKNFDSMQVLFNEAEIFSLRAQDINQRLTDPEEIEKFVNEMTKLSEKVQYELSQDDY